MKVTITKLVNNIAIEHSVEGTHEEIVTMLVFLKLAEYANGGIAKAPAVWGGVYVGDSAREQIIPLKQNKEGFLSTKIDLENTNYKITAEDIGKGFRDAYRHGGILSR